MGSNQGKQPHHADRGGNVWSRDEKRENRREMRGSRDREAIADSLDSNADTPQGRSSRKRKTGRWCRGKEGREHDPVFQREWGLFGLRPIREYRCSKCGQKTYERGT